MSFPEIGKNWDEREGLEDVVRMDSSVFNNLLLEIIHCFRCVLTCIQYRVTIVSLELDPLLLLYQSQVVVFYQSCRKKIVYSWEHHASLLS